METAVSSQLSVQIIVLFSFAYLSSSSRHTDPESAETWRLQQRSEDKNMEGERKREGETEREGERGR